MQTGGEDLAATYLTLLEQNIKNINQFRHVKYAFPCREGMLSGAFERNQFSQFYDGLTAEKIPSTDQRERGPEGSKSEISQSQSHSSRV